MDSGEELDSTDEQAATDEAEAVAPRKHRFFIDAKSFIRNIPSSQLGTLGNPIVDAQLELFRLTTNLGFSELPANGDPNASTFRVYAHLLLNATCTGRTISLSAADSFSDVGFESLLHGELIPFQFRTTPGGTFSFQAAGAPNILAEIPFNAIQVRSTRHIWYRVDGHVTCDAAGAAQLFIDRVTNTNFPSVRVWATHTEGAKIDREALLVDRRQGNFSELWRLAKIPNF